jgi:hypothetical protein
MDDALSGPDRWEGYRLEPLSDSWLELFTLASPSQSMPLVINSIPWNGDSVMNFPLFAGKVSHGEPVEGAFTLQWTLPADWPSDWAVSLHDHKAEKAVSMNATGSYRFSVQPLKSTYVKQVLPDSNRITPLPAKLFSPVPKGTRLKDSDNSPPFSIILEKGKYNPSPGYVALTPRLLPPYPNPCQNNSTVQFSLPVADDIHLDLYDIYGRHRKMICSGRFDAGVHKMYTLLDGFYPGIYILRLHTSTSDESGKLIIIE